MKIFALSGRCATGKGTVAAIIKQRWSHAQIITTGEVVRKMLSKSGMAITHENIQTYNKELVRRNGDAYISMIFEFFDTNASFIVIDSFRRPVDMHVVEKTYGDVAVLGICADANVRYHRLQLRARQGDPITLTEFKELSNLEDEWGIDQIVQKAHTSICNMGSLDDLQIDVIQKMTILLG